MDLPTESDVAQSHEWLVSHEVAMAHAYRRVVALEEAAKIVLAEKRLASRKNTVAEREDDARVSEDYREARGLYEDALQEERELNLTAKNHQTLISIWQTAQKQLRM